MRDQIIPIFSSSGDYSKALAELTSDLGKPLFDYTLNGMIRSIFLIELVLY